MGRDIRRVPPDWEHPRDDRGEFIALFDQDYESAAREWEANYELWKKGEHPDLKAMPRSTSSCRYFWEWDTPPTEECYRKRAWTPEEATHYQVYQTVSEGTPVTPHFATKKELVEYLVECGDEWNQKRGDGGWDRKAAEKFVEIGSAPSMMVRPGFGVLSPKDEAFYAD